MYSTNKPVFCPDELQAGTVTPHQLKYGHWLQSNLLKPHPLQWHILQCPEANRMEGTGFTSRYQRNPVHGIMGRYKAIIDYIFLSLTTIV